MVKIIGGDTIKPGEEGELELQLEKELPHDEKGLRGTRPAPAWSVHLPPSACIGMAAHAIGIGHALGIENIPDLVRLVAIWAGRQSIGLFFPKLATNHLAVYLLDIGVALGAGGGDIAPVDGRIGIGVRQNRVRRVARGTVGRHNQPLLQQALAVDAGPRHSAAHQAPPTRAGRHRRNRRDNHRRDSSACDGEGRHAEVSRHRRKRRADQAPFR